MRKPAFCICENKDADQLRGNREADQRLCFHLRIVQSLYYLNPKFQASSHLLWLYRPVCVGPGRKPRRPLFSERGSYGNKLFAVSSNSTDILFRANNMYGILHPSSEDRSAEEIRCVFDDI